MILSKVFSQFFNSKKYPLYEDYLNTTAKNYNEVLEALKALMLMKSERKWQTYTKCCAPIGNERRVRGL